MFDVLALVDNWLDKNIHKLSKSSKGILLEKIFQKEKNID
jgi:hypothetical protein